MSIAEKDRIPVFQKLMFAAGANMDYIATGLITSILWMPVFNLGYLMPPAALGVVLMILRAWDAITDPVMGNISDNTRTRWGRRRPYLFAGAVLTAIVYPLFWHMPVGFGENARVVYLAIVGVVFFTCYTLWSMPYYGLQLELTPDYDERTRLTAWIALFSHFSGLLGGWLLTAVMFVGMLAVGDPQATEGKGELVAWIADLLRPVVGWFSSSAEGLRPVAAGMRIMCWPIAVGILFFGLLPALFVKERYYRSDAVRQAPREPLFRSLRESLRCAPLWTLIAVSFFLVLGSTSVGSLGQYVNFYYVCGGDLVLGSWITGWKTTVMIAVGVATIPLFIRLGERYDKRTMVLAMLGCSAGGHLMNYVLMTPEHPYLQIVSSVFESTAVGAIWLFLPSMKADVADWDEEKTGRRREGAINSFYSWFIKASLTASMGVGGVVLEVSGFDAKAEVQPEHVTQRMFILYLVLPILIWAVAILAAWFYPLTRARCGEVRRLLEARRGAL